MKRVSVIIPTYNMGGFVREAVDSVLAQEGVSAEVIVVDDGSTDHTKAVLTPYLREKSIRYIERPHKGLPATRNAGLAAARGDYHALLDADDIFLPGKLRAQVAHLEANRAVDVSYCAPYHFFDGAPQKLFTLQYAYYSGADVFPKLLERFFIAPSTVVARKGFFARHGGFNEAIPVAEDLDFWLQATYRGARVHFLPERLAKIRLRREGNIQALARQPELKLMALRGMEHLYEILNDADRARYRIEDCLATYRAKLALAHFIAGKKREAKPYLLGLFGKDPLAAAAGYAVWLPFVCTPAPLLKHAGRALYRARRAWLLQEA